MEEILKKLNDEDNNAACEFAKQIGKESLGSDKYLDMIPTFAELTESLEKALSEINLDKYKDSKSPLIKKDIEA